MLLGFCDFVTLNVIRCGGFPAPIPRNVLYWTVAARQLPYLGSKSELAFRNFTFPGCLTGLGAAPQHENC
jgi:hypothetical protein